MEFFLRNNANYNFNSTIFGSGIFFFNFIFKEAIIDQDGPENPDNVQQFGQITACETRFRHSFFAPWQHFITDGSILYSVRIVES